MEIHELGKPHVAYIDTRTLLDIIIIKHGSLDMKNSSMKVALFVSHTLII